MNLIIILAALICFAQPARAEEEPASNLRHCMAITGQSEHDCRLQYARVVEHCITITGQSEHDCRLLYDKAVASVESYFVGLTDPQIEAINAVVVARVAGGRWQGVRGST
jgi:ubiquitin